MFTNSPVWSKLILALLICAPLAAGSVIATDVATAFKPTVEELRAVIGEPADSPVLLKLLAKLPVAPQKLEMRFGSYINCPQAGVSFSFKKSNHKIGAVFLYGKGLAEFEEYQGDLPASIKMTDRRVDVEKRIGPPQMSNSSGPYESEYPSLGFMITYASKNAKDPDNTISNLTIIPKRDIPKASTKPGVRRLAFRLIAKGVYDPNTVDLLTDPSLPLNAPKVPVLRDVLLDETAIAEVGPSYSDLEMAHPSVSLTATDAGAAMFAKLSAAHTGRQLAIVLDGQLLTAPVIQGVISKHISIQAGAEGTPTNAGDLAGRIDTAINALPSSSEIKQ